MSVEIILMPNAPKHDPTFTVSLLVGHWGLFPLRGVAPGLCGILPVVDAPLRALSPRACVPQWNCGASVCRGVTDAVGYCSCVDGGDAACRVGSELVVCAGRHRQRVVVVGRPCLAESARTASAAVVGVAKPR